MYKFILPLCVLGAGGFLTWFWWCKLLVWLMGVIPADASFAWLGKLICIVIIGWGGGMSIPVVTLISAFLVFGILAE